MNSETKSITKYAMAYGAVASVGVAALTLFSAYYYVDGGEYAREQSPDGSYEWVLTQGVQWKTPFFGQVEYFNQFSTIDLTSVENEEATIDANSQRIGFSDTYTGDIQVTARYELEGVPQKLERMYQANKRNDALVRNTMLPNLRNLLNQTAQQFRGEDFMQGGQNEFQNRLYYQADNGLYVTKRVKKLIETEKGFSALNEQGKDKDPNKGAAYIYSVEIQLDKDGKPLTQESQLAKFGVKLDLIEINKFDPSPDLKSFMDDKKSRIKARAKIVEDQQNEREQAITAKLKGERELIEARNQRLIEKDRAVIAEQQKVEVEKQQAELAKVRKLKELEIAKANKGIQEANYQSAKYEALAIKEKGLAEAAVQKAMYAAKDKELYKKEMELKNNQALYRVLPSVKIDMPMIMNTSGSETDNNIGTMSTLKVIEQLQTK